MIMNNKEKSLIIDKCVQQSSITNPIGGPLIKGSHDNFSPLINISAPLILNELRISHKLKFVGYLLYW